jgi:hypothetical protein
MRVRLWVLVVAPRPPRHGGGGPTIHDLRGCSAKVVDGAHSPAITGRGQCPIWVKLSGETMVYRYGRPPCRPSVAAWEVQ